MAASDDDTMANISRAIIDGNRMNGDDIAPAGVGIRTRGTVVAVVLTCDNAAIALGLTGTHVQFRNGCVVWHEKGKSSTTRRRHFPTDTHPIIIMSN